MQERQCCGLNNNMIALAPHIQTVEGFERAGGLAGRGTKCCEIMQADEQLGRFVHVARAYRHAHAADRAGVFALSSEFDAMRARLEHLRKHPDLSHLEP